MDLGKRWSCPILRQPVATSLMRSGGSDNLPRWIVLSVVNDVLKMWHLTYHLWQTQQTKTRLIETSTPSFTFPQYFFQFLSQFLFRQPFCVFVQKLQKPFTRRPERPRKFTKAAMTCVMPRQVFFGLPAGALKPKPVPCCDVRRLVETAGREMPCCQGCGHERWREWQQQAEMVYKFYIFSKSRFSQNLWYRNFPTTKDITK